MSINIYLWFKIRFVWAEFLAFEFIDFAVQKYENHYNLYIRNYKI